ncbi:DUF1127 domain-containing protein [Pseudooceanicola sp. HF7]|uniref:DUF1127 domain-containing protein n=1 Tax=Pseudooceanicola sp. HF7 TaxID=2721560 RepID=UPI00142FEFCF|nr:DUF1127 domain-containing protein [Pseudooceanicola sp. HF7]NIZ10472.1 DUF1127 domain-containing protein [Pseudooceanicola sp. HF7]
MSTSWIASAPAQLQTRKPKSLFGRVMLMMGIHRERRALHHLDEALLRDIGISPEEARRESARPAWDAPNRWR